MIAADMAPTPLPTTSKSTSVPASSKPIFTPPDFRTAISLAHTQFPVPIQPFVADIARDSLIRQYPLPFIHCLRPSFTMPQSDLTQEDIEHYRRNNIGQALLDVAKDFQRAALDGFAVRGHRQLQAAHQSVVSFLSLDGTRLTELAARAGMTKQAMGQLVDEVERLGYVERIPDPSDGRAKIVRFTHKGRLLIKAGTEIGENIQARYATLIGEKKMACLRELLEELHHSIRHPSP